MVVLPDHLHCIWQFDGTDVDYSLRWQMIKSRFARMSPRLPKPIWQPRCWEHMIRDEKDLHRHIDYIHNNPVKHGYVASSMTWSWSSFGNFVSKGWYDSDWGAGIEVDTIRKMDLE
ncbi:MAG: hypothetical protein L0I62_07690 [Gammaproteobacteria bacterium]|nr:hypothetical protein [Gammaproteobacteria bacterium]